MAFFVEMVQSGIRNGIWGGGVEDRHDMPTLCWMVIMLGETLALLASR